jgi:hypothetical protein
MADGPVDPEASEDDEWTFALEDVGPDGVRDEPPLEPESIDPENAAFFLLGVALFLALVVYVVA